MLRFIGITILGLSLISCSFLPGKDNNHTALCQQLKGRIVMNGATAYPLDAQKQKAELANLDRSYQRAGCDKE